MEGKVAVIVPVYNVEDYLQQCLKSIVAQTYKNLEIILIDDGSTDNSPQICDEWANEDKRIKVIHQNNKGLSESRNIGVSVSTAEYISFVDSDDYIDAEMIEKCMNIVCSDDADIVVFDVCKVNEKCEIISNTEDFTEGMISREEALILLAEGKIHDYAVNKIYKRNLFDNIGFPIGKRFEDIATTYKIFMNAEKIYCLQQSIYFYRKREGSITETMSSIALRDLFEVRKNRYYDILKIDGNAARKALESTIISALRFYDRCLWDNVDPEAMNDAVEFLKEHKREAGQVKNPELRLFLKAPWLYRIYRLLKHFIGKVWRLLQM